MPELKLENSLVDDRYEVRERLSTGSYAEIFVACDRRLKGREIVIKALNTSLQGTPDADLERTLIENFENEAIALDTVRHSHVILRLGHGTAADLRSVPFHYLVLEYMPGGDLLQLCRRHSGNALSVSAALLYFKQICEALAFAHSRGVIHRDLKPNNFLLSADHKMLKVADFGVAKISAQSQAEITRVGAGIYAPPEHHPDEMTGRTGRLTASADIYSLAKSLYTVVCGRAPQEFSRKQISSLPVGISSQPWADALLRVIRRATADDINARYASVTEFWSDLADVGLNAADNESEGVETLVKPRLKVSPGTLPMAPVTPGFDVALAAAPSGKVLTPAVDTGSRPKAQPVTAPPPVAPPPADNFKRRDGRGFVIDLKPMEAVPAVNSESAQTPSANDRAQIQANVTSPLSQYAEAPSGRGLVFKVAAGLLALIALISAMFVVHRLAARRHLQIIDAGRKLEIVIEQLNVRSGPGVQYEVIGSVAQGTTHKVMNQAANGWYQIEVSQWNTHTSLQNQGWVSDGSEFVREK
jgi:serine/threonine protein kinase